jgi:Pyruvate/2-oxoacid:ferredoxin oxidoreductase gamma subunit
MGAAVEREILLTGIGGQGIQLAAQVLAEAALAEGRDVQVFGAYGGMMRGGNTEATVVVADGAIEAPPTVGSAWAALAMHHQYAASVLSRVRPDGLVLVNTSVWEGPLPVASGGVMEVAATDVAVDVGNVITAGMVMLGAFAAATGVVRSASLVEAVTRCVPPYRRQHVEINTQALGAGARCGAGLIADAWATPYPAPAVRA